MRDPVLVEVASLQPGSCFCCGTIAGPFVDTMVDTFDGRVYVCAGSCMETFGRLVGLERSEDLRHELNDAHADVEEFKAKLEEARMDRARYEPIWLAALEAVASPEFVAGLPSGPWIKEQLDVGEQPKDDPKGKK